ncbi:hypothetical protein KQI82_15115 [Oscillibacter sp. MSJ-2]|uniref:Holin n=1 Tax=Dysosmobacter acutus TaxID=2841504 RepID=A0ABS6FFU6_9FIRM|nr:hypothetical protein [Dysosmobacter acutus]MBU5628240.1 hypothetical protein [Dysosmobacter acutus]
MLAEKIPISLWMLGFALIGSGIDYIRIKKIDRLVLCFFALAGLVTGAVFHYAGMRWGDPAGIAGALAAVALIGLGSKRFIVEHVINLDRKSISDEDKKWYEDFQREVEEEKSTMGTTEPRRPGAGLSRKRRKKRP